MSLQQPGLTKQRDPVLDMVRGIGIVLMVVGHSGSAATSFIYLFHMALFFMLSGMLFSSKNSADAPALGRYLVAKIKTLWLPFVLANTVFTVLNNLFLKLNILTADPRISELPGNVTTDPTTLHDVIGRTVHWCLLDGGTQLGGALWFVKVLFLISVLYAVLDFAYRKILPRVDVLIPQGITAVVLLGLGYWASCTGWSVWSLDLVASCYCLYYLGRLLPRGAGKFSPAALAALGLGALLALSRFGGVWLVANQYTNPAFLLATSLCGWGLVYYSAVLLANFAPVKTALCALGRATMPIVILHFLAFKLVTAIGLAVIGGEGYLLAAFPVYFEGGAWWLAYTVAGLGLPLAANALWQFVKTKIPNIGRKTS